MSKILDLKIELNGTKPSIWRRIEVTNDTTFYELHHIIQIAIGWMNYHLYQFNAEGYFIGNPELLDDPEVIDDKSIMLGKVFTETGETAAYEYDFGDGWIHKIVVEEIKESETDQQYPVCTAGKRCCPPEDCGGIWGYDNLSKVIKNKNHPEHKEMMEWLGGKFDPDFLDLDDINIGLKSLKRYIKEYERS